MVEKYNASGTNGRDCPSCFLAGRLTGDRFDDAILKCSGCGARFRLERSECVDTLVHLREQAPAVTRPVGLLVVAVTLLATGLGAAWLA